jgi:hypothetical protein
MAGRKITQLPTLTTPAATDKLVIVDVSDTSESPQGTSKQIALENLGSGLTSIESTTLDVSIDGDVATVNGISGTWIPTITAADFESNNAQTCNYVVNNGYVDFHAIIIVSVLIPATLVDTSVAFTLPEDYPILNDIGSEDCTGVFQVINSLAIPTVYNCSLLATAPTVTIRFNDDTPVNTYNFQVVGRYKIATE